MNRLLILLLLCSPTFLLAQNPPSSLIDELPDNPTFFDFVKFYVAENPTDTAEGSFTAKIKKMNRMWEPRLYPTGNAQLGGTAITNYAKYFNQNGNPNCSTGNWSSIGPTGVPSGTDDTRGTGQVHTLKLSPNYNTDGIIYACSNWGGLWRSTNGGDWELVNTDYQLAFTAVSDIAIDPVNTEILYISTGEAEMTVGHHAQNPNGTPAAFTPLFTAGIYRSLDAGTTWHSLNELNENFLCYFDDGGTIRRIWLHPNNNNQLFIATSLGIFRCDNAQAPTSDIVWYYVSEEIDDLELKGLEFKPNNPQIMYASGVDIYESTDGGDIWASITGTGTGLDLNNLPNNFGVFRINIAVTPANVDNLYAYITGKDDSGNRLYIYLYNGTNWQEIYTVDEPSLNRNFITPQRTAIVVAPDNEFEIYFGTSKLLGSIDYVNTPIALLSPYLEDNFHADIHDLTFEPNSNNLFAATDGGVNIKDRLLQSENDNNWTNFSDGLQISTPYGFDDTEGRTDRIIIGNQDTGTNVYENNQWEIIWGGDGFNGKIDNKTGLAFGSQNSYSYTILSYDFGTGVVRSESPQSIRPNDFELDDPNKPWVFVRGTYDMVNHPQTERMYFTMSELFERNLHRQRQSGDTPADMWYLRSDISKYAPEQWRRQLLSQLDINEANPDWMLMSMSGTILDITPNQADGYVSEPGLYLTTTGGCEGEAGYLAGLCWEDITPNLISSGITNSSYQPVHPSNNPSIIPIITGLAFDPENPLNAWVAFTGYEPTAKVWHTTDGGETWHNTDPNQSLFNLPVNDLVYQKGSNDMLYIGTDAGVFHKDASMSDWVKYCDFPNVRVMELKINYCMGKIRAATFGRSVWEGDLQPSDGTIGTTELVIDQTTTWDYDRGLDKNLRIENGRKLTIIGTINEPTVFSMPKDGRIIVEEGGRLEVINATITNNCGQPWEGIEVKGDVNAPQMAAHQGVVNLNNARIEHAKKNTLV